jgi:hypothetical protein
MLPAGSVITSWIGRRSSCRDPASRSSSPRSRRAGGPLPSPAIVETFLKGMAGLGQQSAQGLAEAGESHRHRRGARLRAHDARLPDLASRLGSTACASIRPHSCPTRLPPGTISTTDTRSWRRHWRGARSNGSRRRYSPTSCSGGPPGPTPRQVTVPAFVKTPTGEDPSRPSGSKTLSPSRRSFHASLGHECEGWMRFV